MESNVDEEPRLKNIEPSRVTGEEEKSMAILRNKRFQ